MLKLTTHQGIPQQPVTGQIGRLIAFSPSYFVVKVKVKYSFVLHTGLA
jgi:hypothetical protein